MKDPYWPHTCASEEKFDMEEANGSAGCSNDAAAELAAAETYFFIYKTIPLQVEIRNCYFRFGATVLLILIKIIDH